jgi:uncharacterized protein (TIGR02466 family)|tara:strand:+ start:399 stop:1055 length:657 start_codon:yes stop_codon:yes gene_type:complete
MNDTLEIASLFPTPLLRVEIPPELSTACNVFDNTKMLHEKDSRREYGVHSENTYIMDEPECVDLKKFVLDLVKDFAQNQLMYDYDEWTFSQTWVTWKEPGQMHIPHTHPNSVISGVFFYGYGEEGTPAIEFHKNEFQGTGQSIMLKEKPDKRPSPFAWKKFIVPFKPGLLLLFPSHFRHSVPKNETKYTRKSVSMNIVPKGVLGDPGSLTELLFNRVV